MSELKRRDFLGGSVLGIGAVLTGCADPTAAVPPAASGRRADTGDTGDTAADDTGDTAVELPDCGDVTMPAGEGPFHRDGAPSRADLRTAGEVGTDLHMTLTVRSSATCERLPDAVLDLWHVMQTGEYDMDSSDMHYRAKVRAGFDGTVEFLTVKPISYYTGDGKLMPAHFHFIIEAEGHETLTTQLRFTDDPDDDGGVPESLLVSTDTRSDGSEEMEYTFWLDASGT